MRPQLHFHGLKKVQSTGSKEDPCLVPLPCLCLSVPPQGRHSPGTGTSVLRIPLLSILFSLRPHCRCVSRLRTRGKSKRASLTRLPSTFNLFEDNTHNRFHRPPPNYPSIHPRTIDKPTDQHSAQTQTETLRRPNTRGP